MTLTETPDRHTVPSIRFTGAYFLNVLMYCVLSQELSQKGQLFIFMQVKLAQTKNLSSITLKNT